MESCYVPRACSRRVSNGFGLIPDDDSAGSRSLIPNPPKRSVTAGETVVEGTSTRPVAAYLRFHMLPIECGTKARLRAGFGVFLTGRISNDSTGTVPAVGAPKSGNPGKQHRYPEKTPWPHRHTRKGRIGAPNQITKIVGRLDDLQTRHVRIGVAKSPLIFIRVFARRGTCLGALRG